MKVYSNIGKKENYKLLDEISKLNKLKRAGIISNEEYELSKKKILN